MGIKILRPLRGRGLPGWCPNGFFLVSREGMEDPSGLLGSAHSGVGLKCRLWGVAWGVGLSALAPPRRRVPASTLSRLDHTR